MFLFATFKSLWVGNLVLKEYFSEKEEPLQKVCKITPDKSLLATGGVDGSVRLWKYPNLNKVREIQAHSKEIDDMDFSPNGKHVSKYQLYSN